MRSKKSAFVMLVLTTSMGLAFLYAFESAQSHTPFEQREANSGVQEDPVSAVTRLENANSVTYDPVDNR